MCEALRELMKDEIQEEKDETCLVLVKNLMKKMKWTSKQAMDALSISASDQKRYSSML